jgi:WD40 repeat protein
VFTIQTGLTEFRRLRFAAGSQFLAVAEGKTENGEEGYEVWDIPPRNHPAHRTSARVLRGIEWDPNKTELYVPRDTCVYSVAPTGQLLQTWRDTGWVAALDFSPAGDWLLTRSPFHMVGARRLHDRWLPEWSIENPVEPSGSRESINSAAVFSASRRIVTLVAQPYMVPFTNSQGESAPYRDWKFAFIQRDLTTGRVLAERPLTTKEAPQGVRTRLAVTPDGSAVIGFRDRSVYAWPTDPVSPARRVSVAKKDVWDVALHPSGKWLLTVCDSPEVSVWDTATWKRVQTWDWGIGPIRCAAISPDGFLAAVGSNNGNVAVWDWEL